MKSCPNPSDLLANPSNKVVSVNLNGKGTIGASLTSFPSAGFTATSGDRIQSWTIVTKTLDAVTSIGLSSASNVQGPIRYQLFDSFDGLTEVTGDTVGQILTVNSEFVERIVITADVPTTDGQPPRNIKLTLNGCFKEDMLRTKAQVEDADTTTLPSKIVSMTSLSCLHSMFLFIFKSRYYKIFS